jgi:RNA polymerase sigma factor (sigma-70 family)
MPNWDASKNTCHEARARGVMLMTRNMSERVSVLTPAMTKEIETAAAPLGFDEAFTLHHRTVFRTARAIVRDGALAEDITQEVFLKLYRYRDSAPGDNVLRAWLLRVTMNVARNTLRGQSRSAAREEIYAQDYVGTEGAAPPTVYERRLQIEETRRALDKIKEPMRSCLILRHQGLSYREISVALSLKETNVGSLIARGRKEFVRVYGKIGVRP